MDHAYLIKRQRQLVNAALWYAKNGWQVVPLYPLDDNRNCTCKHGQGCDSPGKHPWVAWADGGSLDELTINRWWKQRPKSGVGVLTGKNRSGFFILDIDGPEGATSLEDKELPVTPTSNTGRGQHMLFLYPEGLSDIDAKNMVKFLPGLDIRAEGGLFVAPPTLHYKGSFYAWEVDPEDVEIAPCPEWLAQYLKPARRPERERPAPVSSNGQNKNKAYGQAALAREVDTVRNSAPGTRNNVLNTAAFSLGQLVGGGELERWEVESELEKAAESAGLKEPEISKTIQSGLDAGVREPRTAPEKDSRFKPRLGNGNKKVDPETGEVIYERPRLCVQEGDLSQLNPLVWEALEAYNDPPHLFRYAGRLQRLETFEDKWILKELSEITMRYEIIEAIDWYKIKETKDEDLELPAVPPRHIAQNLLADSNPQLPVLLRVVETPVFTCDGTLISEPGYHPSGVYYYPTKGLQIITVPTRPTKEDLDRAKGWVEDLLCDFPFTNNGEKTNAISVFIDPFLRELIKGPTPLRLIEASTPGSGKGLLADVLTRHATGQPGLITQCQNEEEWNKSLISQLKANVSVILIDNISTSLDSGSLAAALTSEYYGGRLLGTNDTVQWPNRALWLATANNPTMTTEIARRTVRIRLDPKQDRPWQREGFKHDDLRTWAIEHRSELIWAALVIIQYWIAAGRPNGKNKPLGSFEHWSRITGGVLEAAGYVDFLSNLNEFYEVADREGTILRQFVNLWWESFGDKKVQVSDLFKITVDFDGFDLGRGGERSQRITFGKIISRQRDRVIDKFIVKNAGTYQGGACWRLEPTQQAVLF